MLDFFTPPEISSRPNRLSDTNASARLRIAIRHARTSLHFTVRSNTGRQVAFGDLMREARNAVMADGSIPKEALLAPWAEGSGASPWKPDPDPHIHLYRIAAMAIVSEARRMKNGTSMAFGVATSPAADERAAQEEGEPLEFRSLLAETLASANERPYILRLRDWHTFALALSIIDPGTSPDERIRIWSVLDCMDRRSDSWPLKPPFMRGEADRLATVRSLPDSRMTVRIRAIEDHESNFMCRPPRMPLTAVELWSTKIRLCLFEVRHTDGEEMVFAWKEMVSNPRCERAITWTNRIVFCRNSKGEVETAQHYRQDVNCETLPQANSRSISNDLSSRFYASEWRRGSIQSVLARLDLEDVPAIRHATPNPRLVEIIGTLAPRPKGYLLDLVARAAHRLMKERPGTGMTAAVDLAIKGHPFVTDALGAAGVRHRQLFATLDTQRRILRSRRGMNIGLSVAGPDIRPKGAFCARLHIRPCTTEDMIMGGQADIEINEDVLRGDDSVLDEALACAVIHAPFIRAARVLERALDSPQADGAQLEADLAYGWMSRDLPNGRWIMPMIDPISAAPSRIEEIVATVHALKLLRGYGRYMAAIREAVRQRLIKLLAEGEQVPIQSAAATGPCWPTSQRVRRRLP